MSHPAIAVHDLGYSYPGGPEALTSVSFDIAPGEAVALIGPNGAGKSTLLQHLNGGLRPTHGEIRLDGDVLDAATAPALRRRVGMVFQDPDDQLFMPTVLEDVAFGPLNFGLPPAEAERQAMSALERVGMGRLRDQAPYRLSAGEKRAVAIATTLALSPDILVMDEPSTHLDPRGRRRLMELLKSFDHTRLIATHDLELVVEVCTRVLVLDEGRMVASGPTAAILDNEPLMLAHGLERPHILRHRHPH